MFAIRNYTDTKCELDIAKKRLDVLMDKKTELYARYFPMGTDFNKEVVDGGQVDIDNMNEYIHELHVIDYGTGQSLAGEIEYQREKIAKLQSYLDSMNESLSKLSGLEYKLYYEIVVKGVNITKAVNNVAELVDKDPQTIWKNYYRRIKKEIKKLKCTVIIQ